MSDTTGPVGAEGATRQRQVSGPGAGDARIAPELKTLGDDLKDELDNGDATPKDMAASPSGDVSSEKAATMAKAKSTTSRSTAARSAARPAAARPAAARPTPSLSAEDSILIAGIDRAEAEADRLRSWADVRRRQAREAILSNPLGSSVVVFAAGMIFGLLLARR